MFRSKNLDIERRLTERARRTDTRPRLLSQLRSPLVMPRFLNSSESASKIINSMVLSRGVNTGEIKDLQDPSTDKANGMLHERKVPVPQR